jgi:hypothetical protein
LVRQCLPIPQKIYNITKGLRTSDEVEQYFPGFLSFIDCTSEQQIPRPINESKRKAFYSGKKKKKHTVKIQILVNNHEFIIHKSNHKNGSRHDYDIYKENHPITPKEVVNVFDLGYLGVEKDYHSNYLHYQIEKRETWTYLQKKWNLTKAILKRGL